jgi:hypothetical protein
MRDDGSDPSASKPCAYPSISVAFIARKALRTPAGWAYSLRDANSIQDFLERRGFVLLSGRDVEGDGSASAVTYQVEFGAESAARAAQSVVCGLFWAPLFPAPAAARLARIELPSMHHRSQSSFPSSSKRICRRSSIRSRIPFFRHRLNRSKMVCQGPYRSGISLQGAPVRTTQNIPLRILR